MISHLEGEYRKANISEKSYFELKEKYTKRLEELSTKLEVNKPDKLVVGEEIKPKRSKKTEIQTPKEDLKEESQEQINKLEEVRVADEQQIEEVPKKPGFFKKLFSGKKETKNGNIEEFKEETNNEIVEEKREPKEKPKKSKFFKKIFSGKSDEIQQVKTETIEKEEEKSKEKDELEVGEITEMTPEVIEKLAQQVAKTSGTTLTKTEVEESEDFEEKRGAPKDVEIEKLRVMVDTTREAHRATDETIRTLSESIGELRSMVFQADASLKESTLKMEKIDDEIGEVKPQEITKKFRVVNETLEKYQISLEKIERKSEDLADKINKVYDMLKSIGGIENLVQINKNIQEKLTDINEAVKYIERLGAKTEKIFIDLNKHFEDFVLYKTKQEDMEESLKDIIKSIDALNVKFEGYVTKKDMEIFKEDGLIIQKQLEEINKALPLVKAKIPEKMVELRREREDILLLLDSMKEQLMAGTISMEEYEETKSKNISKLRIIDRELNKEWKKVENLLKLTDDLLELENRQKSSIPEVKESQ